MIWIGVFAALALAFANGANDNFKGVATLYGSKTLGYRGAILFATVATALGAIVSLFIAGELVNLFQGKGLIPSELAGTTPVLLAVAGGAAVTVLLATVFGLPVSTTHALTGSLTGVALVVVPSMGILEKVAVKMGAPLLFAPLAAMALASILYPLFTWNSQRGGITKETCLCVVDAATERTTFVPVGEIAVARGGLPGGAEIVMDSKEECVERYSGHFFSVDAGSLNKWLHTFSGGLVAFSRAVNDTPKLAAVLIAASLFSQSTTMLLVAVPMVLGGLIVGRKVAETMSNKITDIGPGKGLTATLITSALVLGASNVGMPVSTTHVTVGSIFGIGLLNRKADWGLVSGIVLAWVTTLPLGALLGAGIYALVR